MSEIVPPIPSVAFLDQRTGLISREWYRFLLALWNRTGGASGGGGGGGSGDSSLDNIESIFDQEFLHELIGTTNQVYITNGDQLSGRAVFTLPQDIDTSANVVFGSATLNGTGTGLTVANNSVLGNASADTTSITGYLNPYVAFGNGTDWTAATLGGVQFSSASSAANNQAKAYIRLLQKPYTAAPSSANDATALVGLWIGGNYAGLTTTALPLYLGGMYTSAKQFPGVVIDTNGAILAMDTGVNASFTNYGYSFQSDTTTGYRRTSAGQTRITGSGVDIVNFDGNSSGAYNSVTTWFGKNTSVPVGTPTAADPQIAITYSNTGFYTVGANDIGFSTNGTKAGQAVSGRWLLGPTITDDAATRLQVEGGIRATNWEKIAGLSLYAAVHG